MVAKIQSLLSPDSSHSHHEKVAQFKYRVLRSLYLILDSVCSRGQRWEQWGRLKEEVSARVLHGGKVKDRKIDSSLLLKAERLRTIARKLFVSGDINLLESEDLAIRAGLPRDSVPTATLSLSNLVNERPRNVASGELLALRAVARRLTESGELGIAVRCLQEALDLSREGLGDTSDVTHAVRDELAQTYDRLGLYALARETVAPRHDS